MIKNIIFDWSGVINDSVLNHLCVVNKIFKSFGAKEISLGQLKENWEQPYMRFYNKYLPDLTLKEEQIAYKKSVLECPKGKQFPGIADLLKKFKKAGIKMVVLSSDYPDTLLPEIKSFGLEQIFDDVITEAHDKSEVIHELIERNRFNLKETIFIGDSNHEIETGKDANIKTGAVVWGFSTEDRLKSVNPDFIIYNLEELEKIILNNN